MAYKKITDLQETTEIADEDLIEVVDDVAGTPTSKKSTWGTVKTWVQGFTAASGVNSDITSMTGLDDASIPVSKINGAIDVSIDYLGTQIFS